jgi:hypothetical protein
MRRMKLRGSSTCQTKLTAVLDFLERADQRPDQEGEADRADDAAAHAIGKVHDLLRQLTGRVAHRPEEFVDQRLELAMRAEPFQHCETEGHQRHQRQQRGVHQPHRVDVELAAEQVAQQRVGILRQAPRALTRVALPGRREQPMLEAGADAVPDQHLPRTC